MKGSTLPQGFTLVEVLIFLAISLFVLIAALGLIGSQQSRTQFTQGMRDAEGKIQSLINDVSSGFFPSVSSAVLCDSFTAAQGQNQNCIFIGKTIRLTSNSSDYQLITLSGRRTLALDPSELVKNLDEADTAEVVVLTESSQLLWRLEVTRLMTAQGTNLESFGFTNGFGSLAGGSGAPSVNLVAVQAGTPDEASRILAQNEDGVIICLRSTSNGQRGAIKIGAAGQRVSTIIADEGDPVLTGIALPGVGVCPV